MYRVAQSDIDPGYNALVEPDFEFQSAYNPHMHYNFGDMQAGTARASTKPGGTTTTTTQQTGFSGPSFDSVGKLNNGYYYIPPDSSEATGLTKLVMAVNGQIEIANKDGSLPANVSLDGFFSSLNGSINVNGVFDPKVIYDQVNDRFIVVALEQHAATSTSPASSHILVAVSNSGSPTADPSNWSFSSIDSKLDIGGATWADFPMIATDGKALYITTNQFSFSSNSFQDSRLWVIDDTSLFKGGATAQVYDPSVGYQAFSLAPSDMYYDQSAGFTAPQYGEMYLTSYNGLKSATGGSLLNVIHVENTLSPTGPTFTSQYVDFGNIDSSSAYQGFTAPQKGSTKTIDAGDNRILDAVWRDGKLYAVSNIIDPSTSYTTAHWYEINTTSSVYQKLDQGNVSGSQIASGTRTFDPSIAVDANGDFAVSYAASGPNIYAGAYFSIHKVTDAAGTLEAPITLHAGMDVYYRTFGGPDNRWGDYSSATVDPANSSTFWLFNEYADLRGTTLSGQSGRWATQVGSYAVGTSTGSALTAAATSPSTSTTDTSSGQLTAASLVAKAAGSDLALVNSDSFDFQAIADVHHSGLNGTDYHASVVNERLDSLGHDAVEAITTAHAHVQGVLQEKGVLAHEVTQVDLHSALGLTSSTEARGGSASTVLSDGVQSDAALTPAVDLTGTASDLAGPLGLKPVHSVVDLGSNALGETDVNGTSGPDHASETGLSHGHGSGLLGGDQTSDLVGSLSTDDVRPESHQDIGLPANVGTHPAGLTSDDQDEQEADHNGPPDNAEVGGQHHGSDTADAVASQARTDTPAPETVKADGQTDHTYGSDVATEVHQLLDTRDPHTGIGPDVSAFVHTLHPTGQNEQNDTEDETEVNDQDEPAGTIQSTAIDHQHKQTDGTDDVVGSNALTNTPVSNEASSHTQGVIPTDSPTTDHVPNPPTKEGALQSALSEDTFHFAPGFGQDVSDSVQGAAPHPVLDHVADLALSHATALSDLISHVIPDAGADLDQTSHVASHHGDDFHRL